MDAKKVFAFLAVSLMVTAGLVVACESMTSAEGKSVNDEETWNCGKTTKEGITATLKDGVLTFNVTLTLQHGV